MIATIEARAATGSVSVMTTTLDQNVKQRWVSCISVVTYSTGTHINISIFLLWYIHSSNAIKYSLLMYSSVCNVGNI